MNPALVISGMAGLIVGGMLWSRARLHANWLLQKRINQSLGLVVKKTRKRI